MQQLKCLLFIVILTCLAVSNLFSNEIDDKTFDEVLHEKLPLSPRQIETLKRLQESRQEILTGRPANVRVRTVSLDTQPGMAPTKIVMLPAYSTSIVFFDQTGATWPVKRAISGNPGAFAVEEPNDKEQQTNIVTASCISDSGHSNLTIELSEMDMPIMFPIVIASSYKGTPTIDGIVTIRINRSGPNAKPPVVEPRPADPVSNEMISYIDSVAPEDATPIEFDPPNKDIQAWRQGKHLYLRTANPIIWPAWSGAVRGPGEIRVYELKDVPAILLSCEGKIKRFTIRNSDNQAK
jgi:intracellular multiplication protein IcmK